MSTTPASVNPYASSSHIEQRVCEVQPQERVPLVDLAEGAFFGFALGPFVSLVTALMLFIQTQGDRFEAFRAVGESAAVEDPTLSAMLWTLGSASILGGSLASSLVGALAGLLIGLQPRLTQRGLFWQMLVPIGIVGALLAEYVMLMGWWPFIGTRMPGMVHLLLAMSPAGIMLLAGLSGLSSYKLAGRLQFFEAEANQPGGAAHLLLASWLRRKWRVTLPDGDYVIDYRPMSFWERVLVNNQVVCQVWSTGVTVVPRFDFRLGEVPAAIEVRTWPWCSVRWLVLRVGGQVVYGEGSLS